MDNSKEKQLKASTPLNGLSTSSQSADAHDAKVSAIVLLLTKLGVRRQAKLETPDYLLLADDLSGLDLRDVDAGLHELARHAREPGETAFPDLGSMLSRIKWAANRRVEAEQDAQRKAAREAKELHMREHPEEYLPIGGK